MRAPVCLPISIHRILSYVCMCEPVYVSYGCICCRIPTTCNLFFPKWMWNQKINDSMFVTLCVQVVYLWQPQWYRKGGANECLNKHRAEASVELVLSCRCRCCSWCCCDWYGCGYCYCCCCCYNNRRLPLSSTPLSRWLWVILNL